MCLAGAGSAAVELPEINGGSCCWGAIRGGAQGCTCWEPVYDREQAVPVPGLPQVPVPVRMCADCAYRPHSPERDGRDGYNGDAGQLEQLAATVQPFYCHAGMRAAVAWQHPEAGIEVPGHPADYQPPILGGVPYQAGGQPAVICAGWLLRAAALRRQREAS